MSDIGPILSRQKRRGRELTPGEIGALLDAYMADSDGDAWMRVFLEGVRRNGLSEAETAALAIAIADSGLRVCWQHHGVPTGRIVDVASTGGIGNKTPLIVAPIIAACGAIVPKMSTRGRTSGTIDQLESVGYHADVPLTRFVQIVKDVGLSAICQTQELAPADARLMALRRQVGMMD